MSWFEKLIPAKILRSESPKKSAIPEGMWSQCPECKAFLFKNELEKNLHVCPKCNYHIKIGARHRLNIFLDPNTAQELLADLQPIDFLKFRDSKKYKDRISAAQRQTGEKDALIIMQGELKGLPVVAAAFEFGFIGGSMGSVVGEKIVQATNVCIAKRCPLIIFACSGGARMQESLFSLMQMSKTSAAIERLSRHKIPYFSVMVDPCMGGVSASFAMLGDFNFAEPQALIGFAGPSVIEQTVRTTLPEGFQRSEFLQKKGFIDKVIERGELRNVIARIITAIM